MLIISQNITNYEIAFSENTVLRINLAWCNSITDLETILKKHTKNQIFIDLPIGRIKPPNNKYSLEQIIPILEENKNVKFFAVSNVETDSDLNAFLNQLPNNITIVPKIESPLGIKNIETITNKLNYEKKYVMLDHDDLFSSILKNKEDSSSFQKYVKDLIDFCNNNSIELLRTVGVIFSDGEYRDTQYIK